MVPEFELRKQLVAEWRNSQAHCGVFQKERERAIGLRLCEAMLSWLETDDPAPERKVLLAALRCRPDRLVLFGARAMRTLAIFEQEQWPVVLWLFGNASIRAATEILTQFGAPVQEKMLADLAEAGVEHHDPSVRRRAIERAYWWDLEGFGGLMARVRRSELDAFVLEVVDKFESLHLRGYAARFDKGSWSWRVDYREGGSLANADIPKAVVVAIGLDRAIEHVRTHLGNGSRFVPWDEIVEGA